MYFSIYNDNKISTSKFITDNLIKSVHFPSTVRTPPNRLKNYFIGELTHRTKPKFDSIETTCWVNIQKNKTLNNYRYNHSNKIKTKKYKCKSLNFPRLTHRTLPSRCINGWTNTKNIKLIKENNKYTYDIYVKDLNFPYCKPKLLNPNIINYNKLFIPNKKNLETIKSNRRKRLFLKSFTKMRLLINKSNSHRKVSELI